MMDVGLPTSREYGHSYAGYVSLVPEADIVGVLASQPDALRRLAASVPAAKEEFRYAPGKWSVREVVGHMSDAERVFGYRLFRISRGDETPLAGFDEGPYVAAADFDRWRLADLVEQLCRVRAANLDVVLSLGSDAWARTGMASDQLVSVRALAFIIAGHVRHHMNVLRSRYLEETV